MVIIIYMTFISIVQPFQKPHYNTINVVFLHNLCLFSLAVIGVSLAENGAPQLLLPFSSFALILAATPLYYLAGSILYWIYTQRSVVQGALQRLKAWKNGYSPLTETNESFPDRIENPDQYPEENLANFS